MAERKPRRWLRWLRWGACAGAIGGGVLVAGLGVGWLWLKSAAGNDFLRRRIEGAVALETGTFTIGRLQTDLWNHVELNDVALRDASGRTVIGVGKARARFGLIPLLWTQARVKDLEVDGLVVDVQVIDGVSDFTRLFGTSDAPSKPWEGLPVDVFLGEARLTNGSFRWTNDGVAAVDVRDIGLTAKATVLDKWVQVRDIDLTARAVVPSESPVSVEGGVEWDGDRLFLDEVVAELFGSRLFTKGEVTGLTGDPIVDFGLSVAPLDLAGIDAMAGIGLEGRFEGKLTAKGPIGAIRVTGALDDPAAGGLDVDATIDADDGLDWTATLTARRLGIDSILPSKVRGKVPNLEPQLILDGALVGSGGGTTWPDGVHATATFAGASQDLYGIDLTTLDVALRLEKGVLTLEPAHPVGPIGDLEIRGGLDLAHGPTELRIRGRFEPEELARFGAEDLSGTGTADLRVVGDIQAIEPVWRVTGTVVVDRFGYGTDVRFERIEADIRVAASGTTTVEGTAHGTNGDVYGIAIASFDEPALAVAVHPDGHVDVTGAGGVTKVVMPGTLDVASATGPWAIRVTPAGAAYVDADMTLGPTVASVLKGDHGTARVAVAPDAVDFVVALQDGERLVLDTAGTFGIRDATVELSTLRVQPVPDRLWEQERPVRMRVVEGGIADADIALRSEDGSEHLVVTGTVGTTGPIDAAIGVDGFRLDLVQKMFPESVSQLDGLASVDATLTGTGDDFRVSATVDVAGHFLPDIDEPLAVKGTVVSDSSGDLIADLRVSSSGDPIAHVHGTVPFDANLAGPGPDTAGDVDLVIDVAPGPVQRFSALYTTDWPDAEMSASVHAVGRLDDPELTIAAVVETVVPGWAEAGRAELMVHRRGGELTFWGDLLEGWSRRGSIDGEGITRLGEVVAWALGAGPEPDLTDYDLFLDDMIVKVEVIDAPWESVAALVGSEVDIEGRLDGHLDVTGSASRPVVDGEVAWGHTRLGTVEVTDGSVALVSHRGAVGIDLRTTFVSPESSRSDGDEPPVGGDLLVGGVVPLDLDLRRDWKTWFPEDMSLVVSGTGVPLAVLAAFVGDVRDADGLVVIEGTVGGTPMAPNPDFDLTVDGGRIAYLGTGVEYHDIQIQLHGTAEGFSASELTLRTRPIERDRVSEGIGKAFEFGEVDDPSVTFTGAVALSEWKPAEILGDLKLDRAVIVWLPDMKIRASGTTDVSGTWPEVVGRGRLRVDEAQIDRDEASFFEAGPLEIDPELRIHRGRGSLMGKADADEEPEVPGLMDSFDIAVDVDLQRNVEISVAFPFLDDLGQIGASITRADVVARVGGDVRYTMVGGESRLTGDVDVVEGTVRVLRSLFDLQSGDVKFTGNPVNPRLDLLARMTEGDTNVDLRITGTADQPLMDLSSDKLSDRSQILTFLVTGQSPDSLSADQGQAALDAAVGLLLSSVLGGASVGGVSYDPDGSLRFGVPSPIRNLTADVVLPTTRVTGENTYALDGELQLSRKVVVEFTTGDVSSEANLLYELRF